MIRCDHCGWSNNPDGAKKCQKCNQELVVLPPVPSGGNKMESDRATQETRSECPKCGYPLSSESSFCPSCGASLSAAPSSNVDSSMKKTVRDLPSEMKPVVSVDMKQTMRDVPSDVNREAMKATPTAAPAPVANPDSASFRLKPIDLNIPEAFAFGADADAAFEFVDGQWFITDAGGAGSTYVLASRRIALQKGDVVLIGGRRYKFE